MYSDDYDTEGGEDDLCTYGDYDSEGGEDDDLCAYGEDDDSAATSDQVNYVCLKEEDIRRNQKDDIGQVSTVLSLSEVEASILLLHYQWSVSKVNDEWFADEERVRSSAGILEAPRRPRPAATRKKVRCGICFESYPPREIVLVACGHPFCSACWTGYITTAINDGPGCLMIKCPEPSCSCAVGQDMVEKLASKESKDKYDRYFLRSYVEGSRKRKWCPAPGCELAIDFSAEGTRSSNDVYCSCSHSFCWNCSEDAHRPVDCDTVGQWVRKNSAESENMTWILANSKPCPMCKRSIEKNHGCMHMTCTAPCKHQFCWLCLGPWTEHGDRSGGFYACNKYEVARKQGLHDEAEKVREMAKMSIERYAHYYERWASNEKSRKKAVEDLRKFHSEKLEVLCDIQKATEAELRLIAEAWIQIIEGRRVLKWTYAYGFYLPQGPDYFKQRELFEYSQGEAESSLERLHKCVEKELEPFETAEGTARLQKELDDAFDAAAAAGTSKDVLKDAFTEYRKKLICYTNATRNFFKNLVKVLENGLADVVVPSHIPT
ncbi:unnamed protein product [Thlaspi arvense]|uniref:RBR-type E3 ubiquitin transferase n=1 Tax=Thlaspi arvense TaxID=13288 RepID=A0AAU9T017_THLAR|nr:unnamed protein product [Thlaspi arvense]